jgi:hypothetical protein
VSRAGALARGREEREAVRSPDELHLSHLPARPALLGILASEGRRVQRSAS